VTGESDRQPNPRSPGHDDSDRDQRREGQHWAARWRELRLDPLHSPVAGTRQPCRQFIAGKQVVHLLHQHSDYSRPLA
jgi:hypothetical protein